MAKKNKPNGPASGRTDIAEAPGNGHDTSDSISPDEIAARAYDIYEREGRTDGRHMEHWYMAEEEIRNERRLRSNTGMQRGAQANQPTMSRSARQMQERLPDTMAGVSAAN